MLTYHYVHFDCHLFNSWYLCFNYHFLALLPVQLHSLVSHLRIAFTVFAFLWMLPVGLPDANLLIRKLRSSSLLFALPMASYINDIRQYGVVNEHYSVLVFG